MGVRLSVRLDVSAPALWARLAGFLWLLTIGLGLFAEGFVRGRLITAEPATTLANIFANEASYRLGEAALFVGTGAYLALTAIMYRLLAPLSRTISLIAAFFSVAGCVIWMLALIGDASPFVFFADRASLAAPGAETLQALAVGLLKLHSELLLLGMVCFGAHCLLMGCLVVRASFLPALIGVILALGGAGYVAAGLLHILSPALSAQFARMLFLPGEAGEALMGLWLLLIGVNGAKWKAKALQSATV